MKPQNNDNSPSLVFAQEGPDWRRVIYFPDMDIYLEIRGYYNSYSGLENLTCTEVKPKTKTVTVYQ